MHVYGSVYVSVCVSFLQSAPSLDVSRLISLTVMGSEQRLQRIIKQNYEESLTGEKVRVCMCV